MTELRADIELFTELSILRLRGELNASDQPRLQGLEARLRSQISGAPQPPGRPAPKSNARPHAAPPPTPQAAAPVAPTPAPQTFTAPPTPAPAPVSIEEERIELTVSSADAKKIRQANQIPQSGYTPRNSSLFMSDYYGADLAPADPGATPTSVKSYGDGSPQLSEEQKLFFGVDPSARRPAPPPAPVAAAAPAAPVALDPAAISELPLNAIQPAPASPAPPPVAAAPIPMTPIPSRPQAVIHLLKGGTRRGDLVGIHPEQGKATLMVNQQEQAVPLNSVLAIFVGLPTSGAPKQPTGQALVVTLKNNREVSGSSPDYAPGVQAMTLVPQQRNKVDYIWVPAWAVKAIRLG